MGNAALGRTTGTSGLGWGGSTGLHYGSGAAGLVGGHGVGSGAGAEPEELSMGMGRKRLLRGTPRPAPSGPSVFSPIAWWRSDTLAYSDGQKVSVWPDSSGNGRDATVQNGTPVFRASARNGLGIVLVANGSWTFPLVNFLGHSDLTLLGVAQVDGDSALMGNTNVNRQFRRDRLSANVISVYDGINDVPSGVFQAGLRDWVGMTWRRTKLSPTTSTFWMGEQEVHRVGSGSAVIGGIPVNNLAKSDYFSPWRGYLAEILLYDVSLSDDQLASIWSGYLRPKWLLNTPT
jgi:hypothetical protein